MGKDRPVLPSGPRPALGWEAIRLYRGDVLFRSSLDFTLIGLCVLLFVAPLSFRLPGWGGAKSQIGSSASSAGQQAAASNPSLVTLNASSPAPSNKNDAEPRIRREWFKLSEPILLAGLGRAADLIDAGSGAAALAALEDLSRPNDPNVSHLTAVAIMLSREKDSPSRALQAYLRAAEAGQPEAMNQVGQFLRLGAAGPTDLSAAVSWYEKGASAGSAAAAAQAGRAYFQGWARPVDYARAAAYYRQAAEAGDPWGMNNYGAALLNGTGVSINAKASRSWIEKAALAGLPNAQHNLAKLYRKGIGGPTDGDAFVQWCQRAADQGFAPALHELGLYYLEPGHGRPADPGRAAVYLRLAATKKHGPAQFAFAELNEHGTGIQTNLTQAFVYYTLAMRAGESAARARLDSLRTRMSTTDLETAQRLAAIAG